LPYGQGQLQLNKFELFSKNPPISKVFREIGYADELGSDIVWESISVPEPWIEDEVRDEFIISEVNNNN